MPEARKKNFVIYSVEGCGEIQKQQGSKFVIIVSSENIVEYVKSTVSMLCPQVVDKQGVSEWMILKQSQSQRSGLSFPLHIYGWELDLYILSTAQCHIMQDNHGYGRPNHSGLNFFLFNNTKTDPKNMSMTEDIQNNTLICLYKASTPFEHACIVCNPLPTPTRL